MKLTVFLSTILCVGAQDFAEQASRALGPLYTRAIDANPGNHMYYYLRGYLYEVLGKLSLSIADLTKCLQLNPNFDKARFMRAQLYLKHGQFDDAAGDFDIIIKSGKSDFAEKSREHVSTISITKKALQDFDYYMRKNKLTQANESSSKIVEVYAYLTPGNAILYQSSKETCRVI
ncbi:DnaJ subfamily C member 3 [Thelohanellus kitauei]|uniref:DnaJ subfamily C member 3 n=1 Tax=Thelohanellus kitauei TaxID=669202 RepID=A0A0C2JIJ2_THEKT|nr:DnaJ subfamily C member 3 [Thelohanellus kitauei]